MFHKIIVLSVLLLSFIFVNFQAAYAQQPSSGTAQGSSILRHYPVASACEVLASTNIGITAAKAFDASVASNRYWIVTGSHSGNHVGNIVLSDDHRTAIFQPFIPFDNCDTISVNLNSFCEDGTPLQCSFSFITSIGVFQSSNVALLSTIALPNGTPDFVPPPDSLPIPPDTLPILPDTLPIPPDTLPILPDSLPIPPDTLPIPPDSLPIPPLPPDSLPSPQLLPTIPPNPSGITTVVDNYPTPGRIFLSIVPGPAELAGLMITDEHTNPLLYMPAFASSDFILQPNGEMTYFGTNSLYYGIDSLGNIIHRYGATDGITTDGHELIVEKNGTYTLLGISLTSKNMSAFGGVDSATIQGGVIQTFDSSGHLIFEWRGVDHYNVQDDINPGDIKSSTIDFEHANSIDIDSEGNYLLSNRNLSEITKINGTTGDMMWRFGGNHNQFKLVGDTLGISCQHYVRWLKNGDILLFDNGVYHPVPESRAVEYFLDTNTMTATRKWQYRHTPPLFAEVMGSAERLDNGNTFIGWGSEETVAATEVDSNGSVVYEMSLPGTISYRAIKYPDSTPTIIATGLSGVATAHPTSFSFLVVPNSSEYEIQIETTNTMDASLALYDVTGRIVEHLFDGNIQAGAQNLPLPTASLASGVYFCFLHSSEGEWLRPVLVTH